MRIALLVCIGLALTSGHAQACYVSVAQFNDWQSRGERWRASVAEGRLYDEDRMIEDEGYGNMILPMILAAADIGSAWGHVCANTGVTGGDLKVVVKRHLDRVMASRGALPSQTCAAEIILSILETRFSCKKPERPDSVAPAK